MSLLETPPHRVRVTPKVIIRDAYGETLADGEPVEVPCALQSLTADERADLSTAQSTATHRAIARTWPGGLNSTVEVLDGPAEVHGRTLDQSSRARYYGMSQATTHADVMLTDRGTPIT